MNLIITILIAAFVLLIVAGLVALAWGIAHAPEGHEDETGFHVDTAPAFAQPKPRPVKTATRPMDHPIVAVEPAMF